MQLHLNTVSFALDAVSEVRSVRDGAGAFNVGGNITVVRQQMTARTATVTSRQLPLSVHYDWLEGVADFGPFFAAAGPKSLRLR